jgi:acyl carrier protein
MTRDEIRAAVVRALRRVAPEADAGTLDPDADLREALDIDSMDFLSFVTAVHASLDVDIPERDYPKVRTLAACVDYIAAKLG